METGRGYALRPAGMLALDVVRVEAGLILLEVDYTSSMHALIPEQSYSPGEIGLGRLVAPGQGDPVRRPGGPAARGDGGRSATTAGRARPRLGRPGTPVRGAGPDADPLIDRVASADPGLRRRPSGRPRHERHLEPGPQEEHRHRLCRGALRARRQHARDGMDRRGPSWPRRRDGRGAPLLRPTPEASLTHAHDLSLSHRALVAIPAAAVGACARVIARWSSTTTGCSAGSAG